MSQLEMTGERYVPELRGQIYYEHVHRYALAARFVDGQHVVDIASGEGYGSALLAQSAASVVGIDISEHSVEHARKVYYVPNLRFMCASSEAIPLADASVDVVVSFETIEHVSDYQQMLREIRRILKPAGKLVISSPNKLVYTDQARNENAFHVKELYYSEFRDALSTHFRHVTMFGQRIAATSLVCPLDEKARSSAAWFTGRVRSVEAGLPALPAPMYFIAVCSSEGVEDVNLSSAFIDPNDDLLHDVWLELGQMRHERNVYLKPSSGHELGVLPAPSNLPLGGDYVARLAELESELAATRDELNQERVDGVAMCAQIDVLNGERSELLHTVREIRETFESREVSLKAENQKLREHGETSAVSIATMRAELEQLLLERSEFYSVLGSKSWRMTAPLRLVARGVLGRKK